MVLQPQKVKHTPLALRPRMAELQHMESLGAISRVSEPHTLVCSNGGDTKSLQGRVNLCSHESFQ